MRKIFLFLLVLAGCSTSPTTYNDHEGRFTLEYPPEWAVTESSSEVQFWDTLETDPSIKMVLFENPDIEFTAETTINNLSAMIRSGTFMSDFQVYYYDLGDLVISFTAYYEAEAPGHHDQVTEIQESFRAKTL
jgi:hypothetical protein